MFELKIALGNAAMSEPEDIARALRHVAATVENTDQTQGIVWDENGNAVGSWGIAS